MSSKIILNLAISMDGFIADESGKYDWIIGQDNHSLDTENADSFSKFKESIDVVMMGNKSYQQGFAGDYSDKKVYVATNTSQTDTENIHFINGDIVDIVLKEKEAEKNIYLFGGGITVDPFIKANVIDTYMISIIPIILGKGRPLFFKNNPTIQLQLDKYSIQDGIISITYSKKA